MNSFPVPNQNLKSDESDIIVNPNTGEKFDANTGLPFVEEDLKQAAISDVEKPSSTPLPSPLNNHIPPHSPEQKTIPLDAKTPEKDVPLFPKPQASLQPMEGIVQNVEPSKKEEFKNPIEETVKLPFEPDRGAMIEETSIVEQRHSDIEEVAAEVETNVEPEVLQTVGEKLTGNKTKPEGKERKSRWEAGGRPSENKTKIPDIITVREWDDDTTDDPIYGLGSENDVASKKYKPKTNKNIILNERDYVLMDFMTRHRYCYSEQLARLVKAENKDIRARLTKLEKEGYIRREVITRGQDLWLTRKAGLQIIGSPYNAIAKGQVATLYIQHTIGVANLAVELEMGEGAKNILGEPDFPKTNRYPYGKYDPDIEPSVIGEMVVTEREIRSSNRVLRGGNGSETTLDFKHKVEAAVADETAPERLEGNEWMFVVYGKGEHVPDLVVSRPRDINGKPQHVAIELELTAKDLPGWRRILKWYKEYGIMYDKVYYFTHARTIATRLSKVIEELGLEDKVLVRKYIPNNDRGPFWG